MAMMSLLLQNSAGQMAVGLGEGDQLIFDSSLDADLVGLRNVQAHVQAGLDHSGKSMADVDCVFVDIGPGGIGRDPHNSGLCQCFGIRRFDPRDRSSRL